MDGRGDGGRDVRGMTGEQLRASILQMAMQGKLVEQREEEGTGEELYRGILAEKRRLEKEGRIKKAKPLKSVITEDTPFDLPDTWIWVSFGSVINLLSGADLPPEKYNSDKNGTVYITGASNIENGIVIVNRWTEYPKNIAHKGDLLLTCKGTVGKTAILNLSEAHIARQIMAITPVLCNVGFLKYYTQFIVADLKKKAKSMIPGVERASVLSAHFPLPPLAEQERIVAKIEELMPLVEQYSAKSEKLNALNASFPEMMKKSILQEAVQGRLVPQDPNDEPASVLLKKIAEEKKRLVREGKIKKQKPLPEITEEEMPFEVSDGWEWVRLEKTTKTISDGDHQPPPKAQNGIPFLVISNVSDGNLDFSDTRFVSEEYYNTLSDDRKAENGDVLFTVTGSYGIPVKVNTIRQFCFQRHIALIKPLIDADYLAMVLDSPLIKKQCDTTATGTAQKTVGLGALRNFLIPLPPMEEQKRILKKLQEIKNTIPIL